jgi:hypothetical protein
MAAASTEGRGQNDGQRCSEGNSGGQGGIDSLRCQRPDLHGHHEKAAPDAEQAAGKSYDYACGQQHQNIDEKGCFDQVRLRPI